MNESPGATIQDIQRGICQTGTRGGIEVSRDRQEQACSQAGINPPGEYTSIITVGGIIFVIVLVAVMGYLYVNRNRKKRVKRT